MEYNQTRNQCSTPIDSNGTLSKEVFPHLHKETIEEGSILIAFSPQTQNFRQLLKPRRMM